MIIINDYFVTTRFKRHNINYMVRKKCLIENFLRTLCKYI